MRRLLFFIACLLTINSYSLDIEQQDKLLLDFLWDSYTTLPKEARPKVGVALSAGGARGFAHVGVLEVFNNASLPVDFLGGTSMGAVVGSFYASGIPLSKIWEIGKTATIDNITSDVSVMGALRFLFKQQLPSSKNFEQFINENIGSKTFEQLQIPFACAAMDIKTGEKILFNTGPVGIAVRASMNLPGIFEPVEYRHRYLVDGGVVDYLPVDNVKQMGADYIIAVRPLQDISEDMPQSVAAYFMRTADVRGAILVEETLKKANFAIQPKVLGIHVMDASKLPLAGEEGLKEAYRLLPALKENILLFNVDYEKK